MKGCTSSAVASFYFYYIEHTTTVEPLSKGHFGTHINSGHLSYNYREVVLFGSTIHYMLLNFGD